MISPTIFRLYPRRASVLLVACLIISSPSASLGREELYDFTWVEYSLARTYWKTAIAIISVSLILLLMLAFKYCRDPIFWEWPIQAYIPMVIGEFLFAISFGIHHSHNLTIQEDDDRLTKIVKSGFFSEVTWGGVAGLNCKIVGFVALAWAPWHAIRCSKEFSRPNMARANLLWTVASLAIAVLVTIAWKLAAGTRSTAGIYTPTSCMESWQVILLQAGPTTCGSSLCVFLHFLTYRECRKLAKSAQVDSVKRVAKDARILAIVMLGSFFLFHSSLTLCFFSTVFGFEEKMPPSFVVFSGAIMKLGCWGDVAVIWSHAWVLRRRANNGQVFTATFEESPDRATEEDIGPLENRGVSLAFLLFFVTSRSIPFDATTEAVMQKKVKPESRSRKSCYVDLVKSWVDSRGVRAVKKPQFFVSHCWADAFGLLLEQLASFSDREAQTTLGPFHFWVDIFAINQHDVGAATELPMIPRVIQCSKAVVFTLNPWIDPKTLRRVWCLWELLQAVKCKVKVRPTMPEAEELHFLDTIWEDRSKIVQMLDTVDVQQASATVLSDKEVIFKEIAASMGFDAMNSMVKTNLRRCLQGIAIDRFFGFGGSTAALHSAFDTEPAAERFMFRPSLTTMRPMSTAPDEGIDERSAEPEKDIRDAGAFEEDFVIAVSTVVKL